MAPSLDYEPAQFVLCTGDSVIPANCSSVDSSQNLSTTPLLPVEEAEEGEEAEEEFSDMLDAPLDPVPYEVYWTPTEKTSGRHKSCHPSSSVGVAGVRRNSLRRSKSDSVAEQTLRRSASADFLAELNSLCVEYEHEFSGGEGEGELTQRSGATGPRSQGGPHPFMKMLRRSRSNLSNGASQSLSQVLSQGLSENRAYTPAGGASRVVYRRSTSGCSKPSSFSGNSVPSALSSTSAPLHCNLSAIRERNAVTVNALRPASDFFEFMERLGKGGFGEVWSGRRKSSAEEMFAIKRIPGARHKQEVARLERELKIFERLCCPHIVRLHEVFLEEDFLYLVMDLCTGGNLQSFMDDYADEPERIRRKLEFPETVMGLPHALIGQLLWQMLAGIAYMHHHRFAHRDIKLQNYMIKEPAKRPTLQLIDFGMAVRFVKGTFITGTVGTVKYMAPEVLRGSYNEKCDIWAIGIVCYILCTDRSPWTGTQKDKESLKEYILGDFRTGWPPCDKPAALRGLIDSMMHTDMELRPSAKTLLKTSNWLKQHADCIDSSTPCCAVS